MWLVENSLHNQDIHILINRIKTAPKILILGSPGSGKSYFSVILGKHLRIPVYHLDDMYWEEGWKRPHDSVFHASVQDILSKDRWILEGNYHKYLLRERIHAADLVIMMQAPVLLCELRMLGRWVKVALGDVGTLPEKIKNNTYRKRDRNHLDVAILKLILDFGNKICPIIYQHIKESGHEKVIFLNRRLVKTLDSFLMSEARR